MNAEPTPVQVEVQVQNQLGLHLRAAMKFVDLAGGFAADISVLKDGRRVNGKSILEMMTAMHIATNNARLSEESWRTSAAKPTLTKKMGTNTP